MSDDDLFSWAARKPTDPVPPPPEDPPASRGTIEDARAYVVRHREAGVECPACGQLAKEYRRRIYAAMGRWLIWLVKTYLDRGGAGVWIDIHDGPLIQGRRGGGDYGKLAHWGLAEIRSNVEETNQRTSGMWRPTDRGIAFARGEISVPRHVYLFANVVQRFSEDAVSIRDVLGADFDYEKLWGGTW